MKKNKSGNALLRRVSKGFKDIRSFKRFVKRNAGFLLELIAKDKNVSGTLMVCDSEMILYSVRYALGRRTPAVKKVVDYVLEEWDSIDESTRNTIVNEILRHEQNYGNLGDIWEREEWYRLINKSILSLINETI